MRAVRCRGAPLLAALALALLSPAAGSSRRLDQDFEFDDSPAPAAAHARRLVYEPDNPVCRTLQCDRREVCVLRDGFTALCAARRDVLRGRSAVDAADVAADEDVFYEARRPPAAGCVGCAGAARGAFLCGSDNRTYSSLCRLDLHNCVRRAAPPVRLACRGFCPCGPHAEQERRRRRPDARARARVRAAPLNARPPGSAGCALDSLADRLLDWFAVLMQQARGTAPRTGFPRGCQPEVRWMFAHLDAAGDGLLSPEDLYALRHDSRERCLRPFLARCGGARGITRAAWCGCLRRAARPCAALARAHPAPPPGAYVPACDARGWYRARQCHSALGVCWCVDAHGVERPGSRTKGAPLCPGAPEDETPAEDKMPTEDEVPEKAGREAAGGPDDDEDADGSGDDNELRF